MAKPNTHNDSLSFPWWYSWLKWVLPIGLSALASTWLGLTLTATIPAYGMLKWAPVFFSSLEGFSAFVALSLSMGAIASMVGIASSVLVRAGLANVSENLAQRTIDRIDTLRDECDDLKKRLEDFMAQAEQDKDEADEALDLAAKRNDDLADKIAAKAKEKEAPVSAANDDQTQPKKKVKRT